MSKVKMTVMRLGLVSVLVLAAGAVTAASASAQPRQQLFSFCHFVGTGKGGSFNNSLCAGNSEEGGGWALAYADTATSLLLCLLVAPTGKYTNLFCNELAKPGALNDGEIFLRTGKEFGTPTLLGIPIDPATLKGELAGAKTTIACKTGAFSAQPEETGKLANGELVYNNCVVSAPANCSVKVPIIATFSGQQEATNKARFTGTKENSITEKEIFTEITYEGCEALAGKKFPVKGSQQCAGLEPILTTLKVLQTLRCLGSESSLSLGPNKATYENEVSLEATSKEAWAILLVTL
jgi:hypothetical protein